MSENFLNYIIYLRKSRSDSPFETVEEVLYKHEKQLQEIAKKMFNRTIPEKNIYREVESGETIQDRPEIKKVLHRIEDQKIEGLIVIEPQRLSRGDLIDCGTILRAFKYTNTKIVTIMKTYDLHDKYDEKFFKDELMRGAEYLEYTKEILNRGRLASISEGNFLGSVAPYGYDRDVITIKNRKCPTLKINETEANTVKMIFDLYVNQNLAPHTIARKLDEMGITPRKAKYFSQHTIKDVLRNEAYLGKVHWNKRKAETNYVDGEIIISRPVHDEYIVVDGKHPAIIDTETFDKAQERIGKNPRLTKTRMLRNPFARLAFCNCGRSMSYRTYDSPNRQGKSAPRLLCQDQPRCGNRSVLYSDFESAVIHGLQMHLTDFKVKLNNNNNNNEMAKLQTNRLDQIEKELEELEQQQTKLYDLLEKEIYTEEVFAKRNIELSQRRNELLSAQEIAFTTTPKEIDYGDKVVKLSEAIKALKDPKISAKTKNDYLQAIISKIIYTPSNAERTYGKGRKRGESWDDSTFTLDIKLRL